LIFAKASPKFFAMTIGVGFILIDQGGEDQDEAWLDGPVARVKGKSEALKRGTTCDGEA